MPSLKALQKAIPSAYTVAGRIVAFHEGKNVDLGQFVGDDAVALNAVGEGILAAIAATENEAKAAVARTASKKGKKQEAVDDTKKQDDPADDDLSAGLGTIE